MILQVLRFSREQNAEQVEVVETLIVDSGFGGPCMANQLLETGRCNLVVLEKAADVGELVVLASGPLRRTYVPKLPGLSAFKGKAFHSARWDHQYDLAQKYVVSMGTGGSATQYVPKVAEQVAQLHVFQRSPAWVLPRWA